MKKLLPLAILLFFCQQNSFAQWTYLGLKHKKVNELLVQNNYLYAATDSGLYKKNTLLNDTVWSSIGFQGKQVNAIYIRDTTYLYAGVNITGIGADTISLFVTNNGGITWDSLWGAYDSSLLSYVQIGELDGIKPNSDTIISMSGGILKSVDGGVSFSKVNFQAGRFLTISPSNSNNMWTGGEGPILNPYLIQSTSQGDTWFENDSLQQIVFGDNACLAAAIHPTNSNIVYVGMEGQIAKTTDNGINWTAINMDPYYIKGIKISLINYSTIYASGGKFNGFNIPLFISNNAGLNWDTLNYFIGTQTDALEIAVKEQSGSDIVFIGTRFNGIFQYQNTHGVIFENKNDLGVKVFPNPVTDRIHINFKKITGKVYVINVYDSYGRIVGTYKNQNTIAIDHLERALYFLRVEQKGLSGVVKFVKL